ncbi:apelin receptor early endogenous ligand [Crotalus tigris]|uniref:Apelin receptor early endogenous ligand n=2 Tax=Serpentes TaxID=8570 RepID=A0A9F3QRX6_PYTBI|nr:apelin receptor early endogenous ligand [Python bivittatus]XP_034267315.1 apelin receptor early endogenous ligand [Pantherophis guttatus]XP_039203373.1 apelin receptor early endogenous ligand [Crotalus tigris]XP_058049601.1 apelin receptor early endogenous ligand [Ahaetulla prasina]
MRFPQLLLSWVLLLTGLLLVNGQRPANLANRRKLHRHHCSHRRCMPLHSRVPFP